MTIEDLSASIATHVQSIMEMNKEFAKIEARGQDLQAEVSAINAQKNELTKCIKDAKVLLEFCIETGVDPIQLKLAYSEKELRDLVHSEKNSISRQILVESLITNGGTIQ